MTDNSSDLYIKVVRATVPELVGRYLRNCKQARVTLKGALNIRNPNVPRNDLTSTDLLWIESWLTGNEKNQNVFATAWVTNIWQEDTNLFYVVPVDSLVNSKGEALYLVNSPKVGEYTVKPIVEYQAEFYFNGAELTKLPTAYRKMAVEYRGDFADSLSPNGKER